MVPYNLSHAIRENEPVTHPRLSSCNIGTILPVTHGEHKSHCAEYRFIINGSRSLRREALVVKKKILLSSILENYLKLSSLSVDYFSGDSTAASLNLFLFGLEWQVVFSI